MSGTTNSARGKALVDTQIWQLVENGQLMGEDVKERVQPASVDLVLGEGKVWEVAGLPNLTHEFRVDRFVEQYALNSYDLDGDPVTLQRGRVYLLPLTLALKLKKGTYGFANPKSSTGRIDAHAIVIGEGAKEFNVVPDGYKGNLYILVVPQSFPIQVRASDSLAQLRLFNGKRTFLDGMTHLKRLQPECGLVTGPAEPVFTHDGVLLHLDLHGSPSNLVANRVGKPVDLAARRSLDPRPFFREKMLDDNGNLILEPDEFILASTIEGLAIPLSLCAEMVPFDERQGEIRTHYAGFFDPGFGWSEDPKKRGSAVVCEIRNIGTAPVILSHGQPVCLMRFEYLAATPEQAYGATKAKEATNYQHQEKVTMAKFFKDWA
jgi:dCTP deaminase